MTVKLIPIDIHKDRKGELAVLEDIPFKVKRVFCVYNVPLSEPRGGHAHKKCHQLLVAVCGAVLVRMGDGKSFVLDCPDTGLYVPPLNIINISFLIDNTTLLVLASEKYDPDDYIYGGE